MDQLSTSSLAQPDQTLVAVEPKSLRQFWPTIRPGLEKARRYSGTPWITEDIYAALRSGHSVLHVAYIDCAYAGFAITTLQAGFEGPEIHFWIVYNASKHDVIEVFMPQFERMAEGAGVKRFTFWSKRRWRRRLAKYGFQATQTEYERLL